MTDATSREAIDGPPSEPPPADENPPPAYSSSAPPIDSERAEPVALEPHGSAGRRWVVVVAVAVALVSLLGPISSSGIWDPHELHVADLARRIAVTLLGGADLQIEGADNSVPTLGALARGQLPFTSVAIGFKLFGLHEWAGRLPLALWGLLGLLSVYGMVARLADRVAAAFSVIVLATMPLYFLHARTILGDIVTMAGVAMATAGLVVAVFGRSGGGEPPANASRIAWLVLGLVGMGVGFGARGLLVGIVVPALGVGLAWAVLRASRAPMERDMFADGCGLLALVGGCVAAAIGFRALTEASASEFSMLLGAAVERKRQMPTHDFVIHHLGHGLFPYSAVIPFAIGQILRPPRVAPGPAFGREVGLRLAMLVVPAIGLGVYGAMAPTTGHLAFGAVAPLAVIVALGFRDFERGARGSRVVAMGVCALAILLFVDFKNFPEKGLSAFAVGDAKFPESFKETGGRILKYGTVVFAGLFFFSFMERQSDVEAKPFDRRELLKWPREMRPAFGGNFMFAFLLTTVALAGFAVLTLMSRQWLHWEQFERMNQPARVIAKFGWWVFPLSVLFLASLVTAARDAFRWFYAHVPISRGAGALLAAGGLGGALSLGYYPALAAQISPKDVFTQYQRLAKEGEPLGLVGAGAGSASYYAGRNVPTFNDANAGFSWLHGDDTVRRWLVIRSKDLPQMNSRFRGQVKPRRNLPVLDARSSEILLVSSRLGEGERNQNPFAEWLLNERPNPPHKADGNFGGHLEALGWDVTTPDGQSVAEVEPGKPYDFRIYYEVAGKISGNWETFIHIDGFQRRYNGDHKTLEGRYPLHLWLVGDFVVDVHRFTLEPNFTPGDYRVFFGLFIGSRRLDVKRGKHHENRLDVGTLRVK